VIHHYNFVFHGDDHGHLLALSAYPAFDQPQYFSRIHPLKLHGFVKYVMLSIKVSYEMRLDPASLQDFSYLRHAEMREIIVFSFFDAIIHI
jgi:hypothetical protein